MNIQELTNGQIIVESENLTLIQSNVNGVKQNDCSVTRDDYVECVSMHDERFKPLFVALHNYKVQTGLK